MNTFNSKSELEEHVKRDRRVLVLLCASWCPFCRDFYPVFERAVAKHAFDRALRVYIDDDDNPLWEDFSVEAVPTALLFEAGKLVNRLDARLGYGLSEEEFDEWLKRI